MKRKFPKLTALAATVAGAAALVALPGAAAAADGNHDKIPDRWERQHHLSLDSNQAHRDQDRDGLSNRGEFQAGDNPRDRDSDDDGVMDGSENAGTIASFDSTTGRLTIALFGGDTLAGNVTSATEIKCEGADDRLLSHGGEPGDDNGGHGSEPGDDHGGHGQEPGDDHGGEAPHGGECTAASLVPGAVVQEAELHASNGVATFEEVELAHTR